MDNPVALILAGGRGSRMGGTDKGLLQLHGKPLIEHVIERLAKQVSQILINANRHHDSYQGLGYPIIADTQPGYLGPLAGILAALEFLQQGQSDFSELLITPVDTPYLPGDLYARLHQSQTVTSHWHSHLYVAHDGTRRQSLFFLIPLTDKDYVSNLKNSLIQNLASARFKVDAWLDDQGCVEVNFSDEADAFTNVNTPNNLMTLERGYHAP